MVKLNGERSSNGVLKLMVLITTCVGIGSVPFLPEKQCYLTPMTEEMARSFFANARVDLETRSRLNALYLDKLNSGLLELGQEHVVEAFGRSGERVGFIKKDDEPYELNCSDENIAIIRAGLKRLDIALSSGPIEAAYPSWDMELRAAR